MKGGKTSRKEMKRKRNADVPMEEEEEEEGGKRSRKMKTERKRKRYAEGRKISKKKKKKMMMEAKRKSSIEEEGRRTSKKKMKRKRHYADIPMDVLLDILSRLPARCVWRLRSVCKDWKSQIESPDFADLQLRQSKEEERVFMFWGPKKYNCKSDPHDKTRFYSIDKDGKAVKVVKQKFLHPNETIASSINGLVCYYGTDGEIKVCNPVTREVINLPKPTFFLQNELKNFPFDIGIGFDSTTKTYKVLAIPGASTTEVEIFTLGGTQGWRKLQLPSVKILHTYSQGLYANGCLFWFTSEYSGGWWKERDILRALMTFNFAQEKFEFVPLPPGIDIHYCFHWIREVSGRVCLIEAKKLKGIVKMWTLANSGTQMWVDHHAVLPRFGDIIPVSVLFPIPNGVMLFKRPNLRRYICFYNEQGQVVKSIKVRGIPRRFCPIQLHTESLVSLRSILAPNL